MKKKIFITVGVILSAILLFVGYVIIDAEFINKDWARSVDRSTIVKSGKEMIKTEGTITEFEQNINCQDGYSWQTESLSCEDGLKILVEAMRAEVDLGKAYIKFEEPKIEREHLEKTINLSQDYLSRMENAQKIFGAVSEKEFGDQYRAIKENKELFENILK